MIIVPSVTLEAWASMACFTRPELKVERVSYPVITPSAARGLVDSICWHPEMRWIVSRLEVLRPVRYQPFGRNEITHKISVRSVESAMEDGLDTFPVLDVATSHTPRSTLALADVRYRITVRPLIVDAPDDRGSATKYRAMLERRVARGQCFKRPYLGCREFAADFGPPTDALPIDWTEDLGYVLYDINYGSRKPVDHAIGPVFFRAKVADGVIETDPYAVLAPADRAAVLGC